MINEYMWLEDAVVNDILFLSCLSFDINGLILIETIEFNAFNLILSVLEFLLATKKSFGHRYECECF